ncbi:hypothetical protein GCM10010441_39940 [Kitasatospora paracochleata]|uniref:Uncharacterized protein n=1 Tax=Kitasatospora paracochleata TaxID=58354 RepID=A0ABT1IWN9_9ACTN|nr:hypothetical protein [Kitasatospora paracochleata]MCP2309286.1 hypothetical protein [Kitasatospora paracochleata]
MTTPAPTPAAWLAQAATDPQAVLQRRESSPTQVVALPAGTAWDLVATRLDLAERVLDVLNPPRRPGAPVLVDACAQLAYFLIPPGRRWTSEIGGARHLGPGNWLPVPHPDEQSSPYARWLIPPDGTGTLHQINRLRTALAYAFPLYVQEIEAEIAPTQRLIAALDSTW